MLGDALPKAAPKKKERNAVETKKRILAAAATEFAAKGFDGARLAVIAKTAGVQGALIHHYFSDKEGLHQEVVTDGLAQMSDGVWQLVLEMDVESPKPKMKAKEMLRQLARRFVELLVNFFATNGDLIAILQHESRRGDAATTIVKDKVGPLFEAIVNKFETMKKNGEVRKDLDTRHLVLSCVAMVFFPFQQEAFVSAIWPADWHDADFLEERIEHIVSMVLARILP